jgi:hypothetical protein
MDSKVRTSKEIVQDYMKEVNSKVNVSEQLIN